MLTDLKSKIVESLRNMDKLIYLIDNEYVVLGLKNIADNEKDSSFNWKQKAIKYYENINEIFARAPEGLSEVDKSNLKNNYIRLKRLLFNVNVRNEVVMEIIGNLSDEQLEELNKQIQIYNITPDLFMGKNLFCEAKSANDIIHRLYEAKRPSSKYTVN